MSFRRGGSNAETAGDKDSVDPRNRVYLCMWTCSDTWLDIVLYGVCVLHYNDRYGGPGVELSAQHDDWAAVFHIFMFDQVYDAVYR